MGWMKVMLLFTISFFYFLSRELSLALVYLHTLPEI